MKELAEEIKLTINLMQTDIDDGAHRELQSHLYSLLEMKREEISKRLVECKIEYVANDPMPHKSVDAETDPWCCYLSGTELSGFGFAKEDKPLTAEELWDGEWWCADVSKKCADALKSKGLRVLNSDEWTSDGAHSGCVMDDCGDWVTRCFFDFSNKKQIKRIGNDFYWCKP